MNLFNKREIVDLFDVILIIAIGAFFLIGIFVLLVIHHKKYAEGLSQATQQQTEAAAEEKEYQNPFTPLKLDAKAVYVYDTVDKKVLYEYNSNASLPLASLTKLMTAVTAKKLIPADSIITIDKDALAEDGDTGLKPGERWPFQKLLEFTLVVSSNDGAHALASAAMSSTAQTQGDGKDFITEMNRTASSLGLHTMRFFNPTGLDISTTEAGAYGSAEDISKLLAYIIANNRSMLEATSHDSIRIASADTIHTAQNTNIAVDNLPGLIASKTGYSDLAGGNLSVAVDIGVNHPVIVTVLGSGYDTRFDDIKKLVAATFNHFSQQE